MWYLKPLLLSHWPQGYLYSLWTDCFYVNLMASWTSSLVFDSMFSVDSILIPNDLIKLYDHNLYLLWRPRYIWWNYQVVRPFLAGMTAVRARLLHPSSLSSDIGYWSPLSLAPAQPGNIKPGITWWSQGKNRNKKPKQYWPRSQLSCKKLVCWAASLSLHTEPNRGEGKPHQTNSRHHTSAALKEHLNWKQYILF